MRSGFLFRIIIAAVLATVGCSGSTPPTAAPAAKKKDGELDKLMRNRMNKSYSQLVYFVFHGEGEPDFAKITAEGHELRSAVDSVRALQMPAMVTTEEARSVYRSYNDTLQRDSERFGEAIAAKDMARMRTVLDKIGKTCNDCHHFFRVKIEDAPRK